jgi:TrpR-related protein YerC/YecD
MQVSTRKLNTTLENQIFSVFYQSLADLRTPEEVKTVLSDLLTHTELTALAKRLAIASFLEKERSYENIRETLKVSSATIASVAEQMGNPGFQLALDKIRAEEWAEEWAGKIAGLFKKITSKNGS